MTTLTSRLNNAFNALLTWAQQDVERLAQLGELFALVLQAALKDQEETDLLASVEKHIQIQRREGNVVFLPKPTELRASRVELPIAPEQPAANLPLLFQLQCALLPERVAIDLHTLTGRWAFLSASDLPPEVLVSKDELDALGSVTIFIRDISALTGTQQDYLAQYLAQPMTLNTPHFIAIAPAAPHDLIRKGLLSETLYNRFSFTSLQLADGESSEVINSVLQQILDKSIAPIDRVNTVNAAALYPVFFENDPSTLH